MGPMVMNGQAAPSRIELRRPDGDPVRVLVVDDEPTLTDLLSMALRYEGWRGPHRRQRHGGVEHRPTSSSRTRWCST